VGLAQHVSMRKALHFAVVVFLVGCNRVPTQSTTTSAAPSGGDATGTPTVPTVPPGSATGQPSSPDMGLVLGGSDGGSADDGGLGDGGMPLGWTSVPNPGGDYETVWAAAPDDVWFGPPLTHWYQDRFTQYPNVDTVEQLSGTSASDVYAHGMYTEDVGGENRPWGSVFHWDGVAWTKQSDTRPPIEIWARTPSDLYVNGDGPMWRSTDQGRTWSDVSVPDPCGATDAFAGSGLDLVAIGASCTAGDAYLRWSRDGGATWSVGHAPLDHTRAIAVRDGTAYLSSYIFTPNAVVEQLLRTDDGVSFRPVDAGMIIDTIWLDSPEEIWIANREVGLAHSRDGGRTWMLETTAPITAIYAVGEHDLFAVGSGSALLHLSR
jgi:hypothetical protein